MYMYIHTYVTNEHILVTDPLVNLASMQSATGTYTLNHTCSFPEEVHDHRESAELSLRAVCVLGHDGATPSRVETVDWR